VPQQYLSFPLPACLVHPSAHTFLLDCPWVLRSGLSLLLGPNQGKLAMGPSLTSVPILERGQLQDKARPSLVFFTLFLSPAQMEHRAGATEHLGND
jgi:hypothetical protein